MLWYHDSYYSYVISYYYANSSRNVLPQEINEKLSLTIRLQLILDSLQNC